MCVCVCVCAYVCIHITNYYSYNSSYKCTTPRYFFITIYIYIVVTYVHNCYTYNSSYKCTKPRYICTYEHTCFVLTKPPIQTSPCNHIVILRPNFFNISRELTQGSPLVTTLLIFFFSSLHMRIFKKYIFPCDHMEKISRTDPM